jgi:hypothetical protein
VSALVQRQLVHRLEELLGMIGVGRRRRRRAVRETLRRR